MATLTHNKAEIADKAAALAATYEARYRGCGQCVFLAVVDALRWGGLELMPEDTEERLFPGTCLFTGGVAFAVDGTCGAVTSSVLVMGMAMELPREAQDDDMLRRACALVRDTLLERCYGEYGSILCCDVQQHYFGGTWDLTDDAASRDFLAVTDGCAIPQLSRWATEIILDEYEKGNMVCPL